MVQNELWPIPDLDEAAEGETEEETNEIDSEAAKNGLTCPLTRSIFRYPVSAPQATRQVLRPAGVFSPGRTGCVGAEGGGDALPAGPAPDDPARPPLTTSYSPPPTRFFRAK